MPVSVAAEGDQREKMLEERMQKFEHRIRRFEDQVQGLESWLNELEDRVVAKRTDGAEVIDTINDQDAGMPLSPYILSLYYLFDSPHIISLSPIFIILIILFQLSC